MSGMVGRKNVHGKAGVRFKAPYTASKNKSMLRNVVSELIVNGGQAVKVPSSWAGPPRASRRKLVFPQQWRQQARRKAGPKT
jgi:hypothetical protein